MAGGAQPGPVVSFYNLGLFPEKLTTGNRLMKLDCLLHDLLAAYAVSDVIILMECGDHVDGWSFGLLRSHEARACLEMLFGALAR